MVSAQEQIKRRQDQLATEITRLRRTASSPRRASQSIARAQDRAEKDIRFIRFQDRGGTREQFTQVERARLDVKGRSRRAAAARLEEDIRTGKVKLREGERLPESVRRLRSQERIRAGTTGLRVTSQSVREQVTQRGAALREATARGERPRAAEFIRERPITRTPETEERREREEKRVAFISDVQRRQAERQATAETTGLTGGLLGATIVQRGMTDAELVRQRQLSPATTQSQFILTERPTLFGSERLAATKIRAEAGLARLNVRAARALGDPAQQQDFLDRFEKRFFEQAVGVEKQRAALAKQPRGATLLKALDIATLRTKRSVPFAVTSVAAARGTKSFFEEKPVTAAALAATGAAVAVAAPVVVPAVGVGAAVLKGAALVGGGALAVSTTIRASRAERRAGRGLAGARAGGEVIGRDIGAVAAVGGGALIGTAARAGVGAFAARGTSRAPAQKLAVTKIKGTQRLVSLETKGQIRGSQFRETGVTDPITGTTVTKAKFTTGRLRGVGVERVITPAKITTTIKAPKILSKGTKVIKQVTQPTPKGTFPKLKVLDTRKSARIIKEVTTPTGGEARSIFRSKTLFDVKGIEQTRFFGVRPATRITATGQLSIKDIAVTRTVATGQVTAVQQARRITGIPQTEQFRSFFVRRPQFTLEKVDLPKDIIAITTAKTPAITTVTKIQQTAPRVVSQTAFQRRIRGQFVTKTKPVPIGKRAQLSDLARVTQPRVQPKPIRVQVPTPAIVAAPKIPLAPLTVSLPSKAPELTLAALSLVSVKPAAIQRIRPLVLQRAEQAPIQEPVVIPQQAPITEVVQVQTPISITRTTTTSGVPSFPPSIVFLPTIFAPIPPIIPPPVPFFDLEGVLERRRRPSFFGKQQKGFTPTLTATILGIKGARSRVGEFTGLGIRPVPKKKRVRRTKTNRK